jgi:hypothetical protein
MFKTYINMPKQRIEREPGTRLIFSYIYYSTDIAVTKSDDDFKNNTSKHAQLLFDKVVCCLKYHKISLVAEQTT